jgi:hypothetical protein
MMTEFFQFHVDKSLSKILNRSIPEQKLRPTRWMQMRRRYRALLQKISTTALAILNVLVGFGCSNAGKK